MRYSFQVPEVHLQEVEIEADSKDEALQEIKDGCAQDLGEPVYSYTLEETDAWSIENVQEIPK